MSVELAVRAAPPTVGSLHPRRLRIALEPADAGGPDRESACWVRDIDLLVERILDFRAVLVERRDGATPVRLRPRAGRESDAAWLARVFTTVLGQLTDTALACALVTGAIRRTAAVPVAIECRPAATGRRRDAAATADSWPAERGEIPLVRSTRGTWLLVCPTGSTGFEADYSGLLAALTRCLCEGDADEAQAQDALRQRLAHAVSGGDAAGFVDTAAQLLSASVCLLDSAGVVIAARSVPAETPCSNEIVLRDESGLHGVLALGTDPEVSTGLGLSDLALALLRLRDADLERTTLENRLAVLGCFVERDLEDASAESPVDGRRLVMIRPAGPAEHRFGSSMLRRLSRAAAGIPRLAGLSLVPHAAALLGVYSDDGSGPEAHRLSWQRLLADVDRAGSLRVVVSSVACDAASSREKQETISRVSQLQRDDGGYFDLPTIAVLDHLGPLTGVLRAVPGAEVVPYVARVLGDLIDDGRFGGQLIDTLYAYLQTGGSPRGAGALLHLHGSSVKYRMRVLRELLGERLDDPRKRFDIELALRMYLAGRELSGRTRP